MSDELIINATSELVYKIVDGYSSKVYYLIETQEANSDFEFLRHMFPDSILIFIPYKRLYLQHYSLSVDTHI